MATQILAKGPLSSALGQWLFLGFGTFVIFTGDNGVTNAAKEIASLAFRLATGSDADRLSGAALLREAALLNSHANQTAAQQAPAPIVIHSHSDSKGRGGWTGTLIQVSIGAGACWTAYFLFSNFLPENLKEMMPVTRRYFESAVTSLSHGILRVRDALSEQIAGLRSKQDELSEKQDATHDSVLGLKDDIGDVRLHVDDIALAIRRCESSLGDAAGRQNYMSRGVRLLVQCVGDLLRPSNPAVAEELDQFSRLSFDVDGDKHNGGSPQHDKRNRGGLEYPSSPNLSEIGSTTSDHHSITSLSLHPRPRPPSIMPSGHPHSAPPKGNQHHQPPMMNAMGMSPPPTATNSMKMLQSFHSSRSNSGSNVSTSNESVGPENEHPQSNSPGCLTPPRGDLEKLKGINVEDLLRIVQNGGIHASS